MVHFLPMRRPSSRLVLNAICALALSAIVAGCAGVETSAPRGQLPDDPITQRPTPVFEEPRTELFGGGLLGLGTSNQQEAPGAQLPVNRYLWRATLDTLAFLPLASTDPYGGVIVTDWGVAENSPDERFKVSAFITSAVLRPQSLRVVVNRQQRDGNGTWITAPVAQETPRQLEDAILTKARQLRIESGDEEG